MLSLVCLLALTLVTPAAAQDPVEFRVGTRDPGQVDTGAQLEVAGADAGIAILATGTPVATEAFLLFGNKLFDGGFRKSASISTVLGGTDPTKEFFITRYTTTYAVGGTQTDDLAMQVCGGHGVVMFAHYSDPSFCPGRRVFRVMGTLDVNGMDLEAELTRLKTRVTLLEGRLAVQPPLPTPGLPVLVRCPGGHPACGVLPAGVYQREWANTLGFGR